MNETTRSGDAGASREQVQQVLDPLLQAQAALAPIPEFYGPQGRQEPADPRHVFELRKNGGDYSLHATDARATFIPQVDGMFIYVIKASDPGRVYVAIHRGTAAPALRQYGVEGHTSIDNGNDVLYAGELSFNQRRLVGWDNSSGHYRPSDAARHTNMLPVVRNMLPAHSFGNVQRPLTLQVGQLIIPIEELRRMGARVDGRLLTAALLQDGLSALQANLENRLQFEFEHLTGVQHEHRAARNAEILLELAATRTNRGPLVIAPPGTTLVDAMNHQLGRVRGAVAKALRSARSNMLIHLMPDGSVVRQSGTSLQVFGVYNSVRGLSQAIARGDTGTAAIHVAGMGSEAASLAAERLIPALGRHLQAGNIARFNAFAASGLGRRLGGPARLGSNVGRSGSLLGALISVPFDIYNAVTSFQSAAASDGDTAQDHYVNGGLATVSAVVTISLAAAAFAGVAAAGPLGLIIGIGLAVGGGIYHSVRYVDELDQYARLTAGERFVTGLASFVGISAPQDIEDRDAVGRAREIYNSAKRSALKAILEEKDWRVAIFGDALITPQAPVKQWSNRFITDLHEDGTELVQQPAKVIDNASDDNINARAGMRHITNRVRHRTSSSDTILWATGDGNDRLVGAAGRINVFNLHRGRKAVRGGDRDDIFMLNAAPGGGSAFDGGDGADTLVLAGNRAAAGAARPTVRVMLDHHGDSWEWDSSPDTYIEIDANGGQQRRQKVGNRVSVGRDAGSLAWDGKVGALRSIEHVITSANATTNVTGNDLDNLIVLNGDGDSAGGMGGNDTYIVNGGGRVALVAGRGENRFRISRGIDTVGVWSQSRTDHMMLDFDLAEIEARVVDNSLSIVLGGGEDEARKHVWLHGLFAYADDGTQQAVREDGKLRLWTRDGFALAPILSSVGRSEDGLIDLAAAVADAPEAGAMDLLIQYAGSWGAGASGSAGSAGHDSLATAATGTQATLLSAPMA